MRYSDPVHRRLLQFVGISLLVALFLASCADEDLIDDPEGSNDKDQEWIWAPHIEIQKGDNMATLLLIDPRAFTEYMPPGPTNPDYYKIWISDTGTNGFRYYAQADVSTTSILIDHLTNGTPYYFTVTSHKGQMSAARSDTVMTVPSEPARQQPFFNDISTSVKSLSGSFDLRYFTYVADNALYLKTGNGAGVRVAADVYRAHWSPTINEFLYKTYKHEGIYLTPYELKLFNAETKQMSTLLQVDTLSSSLLAPGFTPDGNRISFLSSHGNSLKHMYDFWILDPVSKVITRISDFGQTAFFPNGAYDWAPSGDKVYLAGTYAQSGYGADIYEFNFSSGSITPVIESPWYDTSPSLSPDNHKIAFISDRSGREELWTYDLVSEAYSQVSDEQSHFDGRYTNLQWLDSNHILITVGNGEAFVAVVVYVA